MGKASSNKKVARAAKAGGGRARTAGERNILFPTMLAAVVILGMVLVVYARDERSAQALQDPQIGDHWHAASGFYVCDGFGPPLAEFATQTGLHTHGTDSIIHIEPSSSAGAGKNANLANILGDAAELLGGEGLSDDSFSIPGGETYTEGEDTCDDLEGDPIVQVAVWADRAAAEAAEDPERIVVANFDSVRFDEDGRVYTIAFAPPGADIPPPPSIADLADAPERASEMETTTTTGVGDAPPSSGEGTVPDTTDESVPTSVAESDPAPTGDTSTSEAP